MGNHDAIQVDGARELRRTLKRAGDDLGDLKDANQRAGQFVANAASQRAPHLTGALAGALRASRAAASATVKAGGARVPYAGPIHWGWPAHNIQAQPFLSDAATDTEPQWLPMYEADIEKIVDKIEGA